MAAAAASDTTSPIRVVADAENSSKVNGRTEQVGTYIYEADELRREHATPCPWMTDHVSVDVQCKLWNITFPHMYALMYALLAAQSMRLYLVETAM